MMRRYTIQAWKPLVVPTLLIIAFWVLLESLDNLHSIDRFLVLTVAKLGPSAEKPLGWITVLGSVPVLIAVAAGASLVEFIQQRKKRALVMSMSLSSMGIFFCIKELVQRARPVTEYVTSHGLHGYSFPSGHTTASTAVYGTLIVLLISNQNRWAKIGAWSLTILIVLIGVSRVYLGAHFPTDVIAGWLMGFTIVNVLRFISLEIAKHSPQPARVATKDSTEAVIN